MVLTLKSDEFKTFPAVLKEYANYMYSIKGNSEKTVCEYLLDLRTFFRYRINLENGSGYDKDEFEKIDIKSLSVDDICRIRPSDIIEFMVFCSIDLKNNSTTRMRKLSSLRSFFKYAHSKKHYIDYNPASDVDSPKKKQTLPKHLSLEECVLLLECVKNDVTSKTVNRDFAIITLFLNTGMRLSELVGLNITSFNHDLSEVIVTGKGNKQRLIYLNEASKKALRAYIAERLNPKYIRTSDKALFLSKRQTRISNKTVQWMVYKYLDLAGLSSKGLSVHKLRHTAATLMYQSGKVDIRVLKDVLGHEQLNTTQIYTHISNANLEDAVNNNPLANISIKRDTKTKFEDE